MTQFRFLTAGESHGQGLSVIVEGLPSGLKIKTLPAGSTFFEIGKIPTIAIVIKINTNAVPRLSRTILAFSRNLPSLLNIDFIEVIFLLV